MVCRTGGVAPASKSMRFTCRGIDVAVPRRNVSVLDVAARRRGVVEFVHGVKRMSALTATSKAFRARLELRDHGVPILQMWAARHCALHACFRSERGTTVLVALRAAPQSSASHCRTIRNALRRCGVSTSGLRGRWLCCITEREAVSVCLGTVDLGIPEAPRRAEEQRFSLGRPPSTTTDNSDARVVELLR